MSYIKCNEIFMTNETNKGGQISVNSLSEKSFYCFKTDYRIKYPLNKNIYRI